MTKNFFLIICFLFLLGCQSSAVHRKDAAGPTQKKSETHQDVRSAVESVAGAVTPRTAVVKYCPTCGRRFSPAQEKCPFDGSVLKELKDE